jgi:hypothetical protein
VINLLTVPNTQSKLLSFGTKYTSVVEKIGGIKERYGY